MQITKVTALSWILYQLKFPFNHWSDNLSQIHHTDANGAKVMERMKIINYILLINKSILGGFWILTLHFIGARNSGREAGCRCLGCLENPLGEQPIGTNHLYALPISAIIIRIIMITWSSWLQGRGGFQKELLLEKNLLPELHFSFCHNCKYGWADKTLTIVAVTAKIGSNCSVAQCVYQQKQNVNFRQQKKALVQFPQNWAQSQREMWEVKTWNVVSDVAGVGGLTGINGAGAADGQIIVMLLNISSDKIMLATDGKSAGKQLKHWCEIIVMLPANVNLHRSFDVK